MVTTAETKRIQKLAEQLIAPFVVGQEHLDVTAALEAMVSLNASLLLVLSTSEKGLLVAEPSVRRANELLDVLQYGITDRLGVYDGLPSSGIHGATA